jgi:hypothetical protein
VKDVDLHRDGARRRGTLATVGLFVQVLWLRRQVEDLSRECIDLKRAAAPPAS